MVTGLTDTTALTVLYDRDCGICTATAKALVRADRNTRLSFEPLQTTARLDGMTRADLAESLHVLDAHGEWFTGGAAVAQIARRVPVLMPVALVARIPGGTVMLELGYRLVAANRQHLSGLLGLKACAVPQRPASSQSAAVPSGARAL